MKRHARKSNLQRERAAADQGLDTIGAPSSVFACAPVNAPANAPGSEGTSPKNAAPLQSHARRRMLDKENANAHRPDMQSFNRVMCRDGSAPPALRANGAESGENNFGRKNCLERDHGGTKAHEGQTFARVLGR